MDVFPKFILEDGNLIIRKCTFHHQIVIDKDKVQGGGWFRYNHEKNLFTLYGSSHDFGPATYEDIKEAIHNKRVFNNPRKTINVSDVYKFNYDTGSEIIGFE